MKKQVSFLWGISAIMLVGCGSLDSGSSKASTAMTGNIAKMQFTLPEKIKWDMTKGSNGAVTIYTPRGIEPKKSPIKLVYQYVKHDKDPKVLAAQIVAPFRNNCEKSKTNEFKTQSTYRNQHNYQTLCNKFKNAPFGMVNYVDIFTDAKGSHILIGEVKTPPSIEPGKLNTPQNDKEKKAAQDTVAFIRLVQKTMMEASVCNANGQCR